MVNKGKFMQIYKEWWYLKRFDSRPARYVKMHHLKTIRNKEEISSFSYLQGLSVGWYGVIYYSFVKKRGGIKGYPMKTFWHIVQKEGKLVAERWEGIIGDIRFIKTIKL